MKLTTSQMAKEYNRCEKTFLKFVKAYDIPHIRLGRSLLFDPVKVEAYLEAMTMRHEPIRPKAKRKPLQNKYAEMLDL